MLTAEEEGPLDGAERIMGLKLPASTALVLSNLKLVVNIARKNMGRGVSLGELIEAGNLGLIHAAESYDPDRGYRFSTFATWWIRSSITRALSEQEQSKEEPMSKEKESADTEVIIELADDIRYEEVTGLLTALKGLHFNVTGMPPLLNYIEIKEKSMKHDAVMGDGVK